MPFGIALEKFCSRPFRFVVDNSLDDDEGLFQRPQSMRMHFYARIIPIKKPLYNPLLNSTLSYGTPLNLSSNFFGSIDAR